MKHAFGQLAHRHGATAASAAVGGAELPLAGGLGAGSRAGLGCLGQLDAARAEGHLALVEGGHRGGWHVFLILPGTHIVSQAEPLDEVTTPPPAAATTAAAAARRRASAVLGIAARPAAIAAAACLRPEPALCQRVRGVDRAREGAVRPTLALSTGSAIDGEHALDGQALLVEPVELACELLLLIVAQPLC